MTQQQEKVKADETKAWILASPSHHQPQNWPRRINRSVCCTWWGRISTTCTISPYAKTCKCIFMFVQKLSATALYTPGLMKIAYYTLVCARNMQMILLWLFIWVDIRRGTRIYGLFNWLGGGRINPLPVRLLRNTYIRPALNHKKTQQAQTLWCLDFYLKTRTNLIRIWVYKHKHTYKLE